MCGKMSQDHGIIFSSGEIWKETRRFTLRALRDIGFGKKTSESLGATSIVKIGEVRLSDEIGGGG